MGRRHDAALDRDSFPDRSRDGTVVGEDFDTVIEAGSVRLIEGSHLDLDTEPANSLPALIVPANLDANGRPEWSDWDVGPLE